MGKTEEGVRPGCIELFHKRKLKTLQKAHLRKFSKFVELRFNEEFEELKLNCFAVVALDRENS